MGHETEDVAAAIADPGDIVARAIGICGVSNGPVGVAIAKDDPLLTLQLVQSSVVAGVVSFRVRDRHPQHAAASQFVGERRFRAFDPDVHVVADKVQIAVANQRPR